MISIVDKTNTLAPISVAMTSDVLTSTASSVKITLIPEFFARLIISSNVLDVGSIFGLFELIIVC